VSNAYHKRIKKWHLSIKKILSMIYWSRTGGSASFLVAVTDLHHLVTIAAAAAAAAS